MPIRVTCPSCGGVLTAPDAAAGKRGKCPKCKTPIPIPTVAAPAPARPSEPVPTAAVVRPSATRKEAEFDIEILADPPAERPAPVAALPVPNPVQPHNPGNPFAVFGPPPDSVAAKLVTNTNELDASRRSPLHPGWQTVVDGLGSLRLSAQIGLAVAGLSVFVSVASILELSIALYAALAIWMLAGLVSLVFHTIGLIRCLKMPPPEKGGAGRGLVLTALILTIAGFVLAPCLVGSVGLLAVPFVLGAFLRELGQAFSDRPTSAAAVKYLYASGVAVLSMILAPVILFVFLPALIDSRGSIRSMQIAGILMSVGTTAVYLVTMYLYLAALTHAERTVRSAVRTRGLIKESVDEPRQAPHIREFDDEAPTPLATRRPTGRPKGPRRDDPPFA